MRRIDSRSPGAGCNLKGADQNARFEVGSALVESDLSNDVGMKIRHGVVGSAVVQLSAGETREGRRQHDAVADKLLRIFQGESSRPMFVRMEDQTELRLTRPDK